MTLEAIGFVVVVVVLLLLLFSPFCSFPLCQSVRVVPGFECSMRLSFHCDEVQVLVVRRDIHKAY